MEGSGAPEDVPEQPDTVDPVAARISRGEDELGVDDVGDEGGDDRQEDETKGERPETGENTNRATTASISTSISG